MSQLSLFDAPAPAADALPMTTQSFDELYAWAASNLGEHLTPERCLVAHGYPPCREAFEHWIYPAPGGRASLETVASPICVSDGPCKRQGRAVLGPERASEDGDCVNRSITCLTCGSTGEQSTNLKAKEPRPRKAAKA